MKNFKSLCMCFKRIWFVVMFLALNSMLLFAAGSAHAVNLVTESFTGATAPYANWPISGNAAFITATQADTTSGIVVQLTPNSGTQAGMLVYNKPFSSAFGDTITFDYYMPSTTGADGIAFFLVNGTQTTVTLGKSGGTLGYGTGYTATNGVPNAYAAVGFDVYGNGRNEFGNSAGTGTNSGGLLTNNVCIVGSGNLLSGYRYLTGSQNSTIAGTAWRKAEVKVTRGNGTGCASNAVCLSVRYSTDNGLNWTQVYTDQRIDNATGQATLPDTFKLGFSASTGGSWDYHYIDNVVINLGGFGLDVVKAGTGTGTVTSTSNPTQTTQLNCGSTCTSAYPNNTIVTLTATPDASSSFTGWSGGTGSATCTGTGTCAITITANSAVTANFAINTYTLTYTAGANGSISGTSPQTVNYGASGTAVTAVPSTGYHFVNWSDSSTANPRTDTNVTANISVTANFAINTYTLTYTAGANGSISGTSPQTVNYGASGTAVTAVPSTGYHFVNWSDSSITNPRTDTNVTANISVTANFALNTYTVTPSAGADGSIAPSTPQTINYNATTTFTVTPNAGYTASVGGTCSGTLVGTTYTTNAITSNCTVTATFTSNTPNTPTTYTVTPSAGANGSISPNTPQTVNRNSTKTFTVTPNAGYTASVGGTCGGTLSGNTYTTNAITANCTVTATFAFNNTVFPAITKISSFAYQPTDQPVLSADPASAKPIGLGSAASGGDTLSIKIELNAFAEPVDLYILIYAPGIDPDNYYFLKPDNTLQPVSAGLEPWKSNVTGAVNESLFGNILLSSLPAGTYDIYLAVSPASAAHSSGAYVKSAWNVSMYYVWETSFDVRDGGSTIPLPTGTQSYVYKATAFHVINTDPSLAEPIGLGSLALDGNSMGLSSTGSQGDTLGIDVGLEAFSGPVDLYIAIYAPAIDPANYYLLKPDNTLQALSAGIVKWKNNVTGTVNEVIFTNIQTSSLPSGAYDVYLLASPSGSLDAYDLWKTTFVIP